MGRFFRNPNGQFAVCNVILAVLTALADAPMAAGVTAVMARLYVSAYLADRDRAGRQ